MENNRTHRARRHNLEQADSNRIGQYQSMSYYQSMDNSFPPLKKIIHMKNHQKIAFRRFRGAVSYSFGPKDMLKSAKTALVKSQNFNWIPISCKPMRSGHKTKFHPGQA
ncbi:hypothetical protein ACTXT7_010984 [Hymenolepis weldensis]